MCWLTFVIGFLSIASEASVVPTCDPKGDYNSRFLCSHCPHATYRKAAVTSNNGICSEIGRGLLKRGGNAVDAAIGVAVCLGVASPEYSGLGGGHFATIYMKKLQKCHIVNARETAPFRSTVDMFYKEPSSSQYGAKSIAVPGELYGYWMAFETFGSGKLTWKQLFEPSIRLCKEGIVKAQGLPDFMQYVQDSKRHVQANNSLHVFYNKAKQRPYAAGETYYRHDLAKTLKALANADDPISLFYDSSFTRMMVDEINAAGGIMTMRDFNAYTATLEPALKMCLGQNLVACAPYPPASGSLVLAGLNILQGEKWLTSSDFYHRLLEAMKFVFGQRSLLGDPTFHPEAIAIAKGLVKAIFGEMIRGRITKRTHEPEYYGTVDAFIKIGGTAHLSVVDADGNAVSLTPTINTYLGSKFRSEKTGIVWNNEMDDFSTAERLNFLGIAPSRKNQVRPGKRPMSSCSPIVLYDKRDGHVKHAAGAAGGSRIISTLIDVLQRMLLFNQTVEIVGNAPRLHTQLYAGEVLYEEGFSKVTIA